MSLAASCPRCSSPVAEDDEGWRCLDHGPITPLWRPAEASYDALTEHLLRCTTVPTLLPWPLSPGWTITDFGCVGSPRDGEARASLASCSGTSDLDGVVELTVVSEEPGVGRVMDPRFRKQAPHTELGDIIVASVPSCVGAVRAMIDAYDRHFGDGTGEAFFMGPYLDALPAAVSTQAVGAE